MFCLDYAGKRDIAIFYLTSAEALQVIHRLFFEGNFKTVCLCTCEGCPVAMFKYDDGELSVTFTPLSFLADFTLGTAFHILRTGELPDGKDQRKETDTRTGTG